MADKNPFPGENNTGHIWDDNLRELNNPPPAWWMWAFWASVAAWVVYGVLYPMWPLIGEKGYTTGMMGWTAMGEYKLALGEVQAIRAPYEEKIKQMPAAAILADKDLSVYVEKASKVLFGDNCAACHATGGAGNVGFPVLADNDWLYGGTIQTIEQTLTNGRKGVMTAHGKILSADELNTMAAYVMNLSAGTEDAAGKDLFMKKGCIACHGMDGKGMQALGSANLTDQIFRFLPGPGETQLDAVKYTIAHGVNDVTDPMTREAVMPSFKGRLAAEDIKKLAVYVHKLGGGQ